MHCPFIAANWKMHKVRDDALGFARELAERLPHASELDIVLFVPSLYVAEISLLLQDSIVHVGVQNLFWEEFGSYTGEISASMARSVGARYALIGHSERRIHLHETDEEISRKVGAAVNGECAPVLCIGEERQERESGRMAEGIRQQLELGLARIDRTHIAGVTLAYEPLWAIGTGVAANREEVVEAHQVVRESLEACYDSTVARATRIIYGGSVTQENVVELLQSQHVDGVLVGGASLKLGHFLEIVQAARSLV